MHRPDNTQHSQQTDIHIISGIQTRNTSKWAAADSGLIPRGHWDRRLETYACIKHGLSELILSIYEKHKHM